MAKLMFSKSHEWILVEGSKGKMGISDHAQKQLGDLVFVELPGIGEQILCGKPFMNVESVKAVSELYAPACGKIIAINEELETNPEKINEAPMQTWIVEIEISKLSESLMTEEEYKSTIS